MDETETPRTLLSHILKTENPLQTVRPLKRHLSVVKKNLIKSDKVHDREHSLNNSTPRTLISQALDYSDSLATIRQKKRHTAHTITSTSASTIESESPEASSPSTDNYAERRHEWKRIPRKNVFKRIRLSELSFSTKENTSMDEYTENVLVKIREAMMKKTSIKSEVSQVSFDSKETQELEKPNERESPLVKVCHSTLKDSQPSNVDSDEQVAASLLSNQFSDEFTHNEVSVQTPNEEPVKEESVNQMEEKTDRGQNEDLNKDDASDHMEHVSATESDNSSQDIVGPLQLNITLETEASFHESNRERSLKLQTDEVLYSAASISVSQHEPEQEQASDPPTSIGNDDEKQSQATLPRIMQQQPRPTPQPKESPRRVKRTRKQSKSNFPITKKQLRGYIRHYSSLNLSKEALKEVEKLSEEYLCQTSHHLEKICKKRKKKEVSVNDMTLLLKRRQNIPRNRTLSALVRENLPLEYCEEILATASAGNIVYPKADML